MVARLGSTGNSPGLTCILRSAAALVPAGADGHTHPAINWAAVLLRDFKNSRRNPAAPIQGSGLSLYLRQAAARKPPDCFKSAAPVQTVFSLRIFFFDKKNLLFNPYCPVLKGFSRDTFEHVHGILTTAAVNKRQLSLTSPNTRKFNFHLSMARHASLLQNLPLYILRILAAFTCMILRPQTSDL